MLKFLVIGQSTLIFYANSTRSEERQNKEIVFPAAGYSVRETDRQFIL